jgi:ribosome-binding protein aMBF1 (putative translation factor)
MDHQDHKLVIINGKKKPIEKKDIIPRIHTDLHALKIENEQENFTITTIPKKICTQIAQARNLKKLTQKEMAQKIGIQLNIYVTLENGKATYDGKTKEMINKIQKVLGTRFNK